MTVPPWERCYVKDCLKPATEEHIIEKVGRAGMMVEVALKYCGPHFVQALRFKLGRRRAA